MITVIISSLAAQWPNVYLSSSTVPHPCVGCRSPFWIEYQSSRKYKNDSPLGMSRQLPIFRIAARLPLWWVVRRYWTKAITRLKHGNRSIVSGCWSKLPPALTAGWGKVPMPTRRVVLLRKGAISSSSTSSSSASSSHPAAVGHCWELVNHVSYVSSRPPPVHPEKPFVFFHDVDVVMTWCKLPAIGTHSNGCAHWLKMPINSGEQHDSWWFTGVYPLRYYPSYDRVSTVLARQLALLATEGGIRLKASWKTFVWPTGNSHDGRINMTWNMYTLIIFYFINTETSL